MKKNENQNNVVLSAKTIHRKQFSKNSCFMSTKTCGYARGNNCIRPRRLEGSLPLASSVVSLPPLSILVKRIFDYLRKFTNCLVTKAAAAIL